jgi:hypothetical protein
MQKLASLLSLATGAVLLTATAAEYPLEFKTLGANETLEFAGGYGYASGLEQQRLPSLKNEPKPVSRHPLYGQFGFSTNDLMLFRVDETKGDRKGYDQLILDLNRNGI